MDSFMFLAKLCPSLPIIWKLLWLVVSITLPPATALPPGEASTPPASALPSQASTTLSPAVALPPEEASASPALALPSQASTALPPALTLPPGEASTSQATALPPGEANASLATALSPREGITPSQANTPPQATSHSYSLRSTQAGHVSNTTRASNIAIGAPPTIGQLRLPRRSALPPGKATPPSPPPVGFPKVLPGKNPTLSGS